MNEKSYLIPKKSEFLQKNEIENEKVNENGSCKYQRNKDIFKIFYNDDNTENILIDINLKNNNIIYPKRKDFIDNFNCERLTKIMNKNKRNNPRKSIDYMKKPYNKILFNYSFEKNNNDKNIKIKNQRKSFIEKGKMQMVLSLNHIFQKIK